MYLTNESLLKLVWGVAIAMLVTLSASIAAAQPTPTSTDIYSLRGWDEDNIAYMWFDVAFDINGNSNGGNIWLMDSDRTPVGTDPLLRITNDEMTFDFAGTGQLDWSTPAGSYSGIRNDSAFVVHNGVALALTFSDLQGPEWSVVPEPSALLLMLAGLGLIGAIAAGRVM